MIRKFVLAVMLATSVVGGAIVSAAPVAAAEAQTPTIAERVAALLAQYPDGGAGLKTAIAALIAGAEDPAAVAAQIILALPAGTPKTQLASVGDAINDSPTVTSANLEAAIATAVEGSSDPVAATKLILAEAPFLGNDHQAALGRALATAAANIGVLNPSAAADMKSVVASSDVEGVKTAYTDQETTYGSINNNQQQNNETTEESGRPAVSPN